MAAFLSCALRSAWQKATRRSMVMAFLFSGLLSVIVYTPSVNPSRTTSMIRLLLLNLSYRPAP